MRLLLLLVFVHQIFARSQPAQLTAENFHRCLNPFSFDFLKKLEYENKNVIYSPLGIGMAVGMLLEGAQNEDKEKLFELLHCNNYGNRDTIHQQFKSILDEYKEMATREQNPRNATVELSNLAVYAEQFNLSQTFIDALKNHYEANVGKENFANNGVQIKEKLNKFVKERTHDLIPEVFKEPLKPNTVMVILNTIFFKGYWETYFSQPIFNETFYNADKSESTVEMMSCKAKQFKHSRSSKHNASIIELPYLGSLSMIVMLPDEKAGLPQLLQTLNEHELESFIESMSSQYVKVFLPKFTYEYSIDLISIFQKMGVNIETALTSLNRALRISSASHKAKIQVHQSGTEAAAVTSFEFTLARPAAPPPPPITFKADHPFVFFIRDMKSNINLFAGVVNKFN